MRVSLCGPLPAASPSVYASVSLSLCVSHRLPVVSHSLTVCAWEQQQMLRLLRWLGSALRMGMREITIACNMCSMWIAVRELLCDPRSREGHWQLNGAHPSVLWPGRDHGGTWVLEGTHTNAQNISLPARSVCVGGCPTVASLLVGQLVFWNHPMTRGARGHLQRCITQ